MPLDEPDAITQARTANQFAAHLYLGFEATNGSSSVVHFYRVPTFESLGGRTMAACLTRELSACGLQVSEPCGMRLPVLRETRMPAVLCSLAPVRTAVDSAQEISHAVLRAIEQWVVVCSLVS
ncbi:MAG: putative cell wall hydrolase [Acidimicrobiaceae bacterium]|nr:MAG: putative cell wall hydrolase [Acidimicrobiaceae bacterium]